MDEHWADQLVPAELEATVIMFQRRLADVTAERDRWQAHAERVAAERDRLRAIVDGLRGYLSMDVDDSPDVTAVLDDLRAILIEAEENV